MEYILQKWHGYLLLETSGLVQTNVTGMVMYRKVQRSNQPYPFRIDKKMKVQDMKMNVNSPTVVLLIADTVSVYMACCMNRHLYICFVGTFIQSVDDWVMCVVVCAYS